MTVESLFEILEGIASHITARIADDYGVIARGLTRDSLSKRPQDLSALEAVLAAHHYNIEITPATCARAIAGLEHAVEIDPEYAMAWAMLALVCYDAFAHDFVVLEDGLGKALEAARRAVTLDPTNAHAHLAMGYTGLYDRDTSVVLHCRRACELSPNAALVKALAGWVMALAGEQDAGLALMREGAELNPYYPSWLHGVPCLCHYHAGEYELALVEASRFATPDVYWGPLLLAACLGQLGQTQEARSALDALLELCPAFPQRCLHHLRCFICRDEWIEHLLDGLRKAGLPAAGNGELVVRTRE